MSVNTLGYPNYITITAPTRSPSSAKQENQTTHSSQQWPWRGFAFCSDLGTIGYLLHKPKLGTLGWSIALPYYIYNIFKQPKGPKRNHEIAYQVTANGILPFMAIKIGIWVGQHLHPHLIQMVDQCCNPNTLSQKISKISLAQTKVLGGLCALLALTPTVGDPISKQITGE